MRYCAWTGLVLLALNPAVSAWGFNKDAASGTVEIVSAPSTVDAAIPTPATAASVDEDDDLDEADWWPGLPSPTPAATAVVKAVRAAPTPPPPFTGWEYPIGPFKFRPTTLYKEAAALVALLAYFLLSRFGGQLSSTQAAEWFKANLEEVAKEFAQVGFGGKRFEADGGDEFVSFATGRRAVESLTIRGLLDPGFESGANKVVLNFKLRTPSGTPNCKFVFAIVLRTHLTALRASRWDLRTFTNVMELPGIIPDHLIVMAENQDVADAMIGDERYIGLVDGLIKAKAGSEYFESLVITDMPAEKPDEEKPTLPENEYNLIMTLRLPPKADSALTARFIPYACNLADVLFFKQKIVNPIPATKLKKRRKEELERLKAPLIRSEQAAALRKKEIAEGKKSKWTMGYF